MVKSFVKLSEMQKLKLVSWTLTLAEMHMSSSTPPRPSEISMKGKSEASFDIEFKIQSYAESMKKIVGAL